MIPTYTKFNMTAVLEESKKKIETQLNQKVSETISLSGKMKDVRVKSIFPDSKKLIIQTNLKGNLNVNIK